MSDGDPRPFEGEEDREVYGRRDLLDPVPPVDPALEVLVAAVAMTEGSS